jgi:four helix bundle protein
MKENVVHRKAFDFAIRVYTYCKWLKSEKKEFDLARQLLKSGTSIGANLAEANGAISGNDFSNKISIAYKETLETQFWLKLLKAVKLLDDSKYATLHEDADEIGRILFAIIKTTRINNH